MNDEKYYYSVGRSGTDPVRTTEIKIKRSRFICSLAYADSMAAAKAFITAVSKENHTANHNCWAYVVGDRGQFCHSSDAGEPGGTAGKPMLNTLQSHDMTCTAAVVTRYFGGVKLGVRGLIEAYSLAVQTTIDDAPLVKLINTDTLWAQMAYAMNDTFLNRLKSFDATVAHTDYAEKVRHRICVASHNLEALERCLKEYQSQGLLTYGLDE